MDGVAWYSANSGSTTHAVKTKTANGRGLYDLSGNVWEWVWDGYQSNYEALPSTDPIGPSTSAYRVIRGGSWYSSASSARVARRYVFAPTDRGDTFGFRQFLFEIDDALFVGIPHLLQLPADFGEIGIAGREGRG